MNKIFSIQSNEYCSGCTACQTVCPVNAITMMPSTEGFLYPCLDDSKCIHCNKCEKVCPIFIQKKTNDAPKKICGLIHSDINIWKKSTSGGAFTAICQIYGDSDTVIFGVFYNQKTRRAEHTYVIGVENISIFYGSKYVQSYLGDTFVKIAEFLKQGRKVIFSGTPCQITGLKSVLRHINTDQLLCIDLICNGVSSPSCFEQYVIACENKYGDRIVDYRFRDKKIVLGFHRLYRRTITLKNHKNKSSCNDLYNKCYTPKILCRQSCFNCGYTIEDLDSDLTIGDFKKMYSSVSNAPLNKNASIVISHTNKGNEIFEQLLNISKVYNITFSDFDYPKSSNGDLTKRNAFFAEFLENPTNIISLLKKYSPKATYKQKIAQFLPDKLKAIIKNKLRGKQ